MTRGRAEGALCRLDALDRLAATAEFDVLIIGGGATGLGIALDAAARGLAVVLLERDDFAKGTSSRSTKLVHGGVRYLAQGNLTLVREALRERKYLLENAPHLARPLPFLMPVYGHKGRWLDVPFYGTGLRLYDLLAGKDGLGRTELLDASSTLKIMPGVRPDGLAGAIRYWDGQFDDARLAIALARTAAAHGAVVLNHVPVTALLRAEGLVRGAAAVDRESGRGYRIQARCVINATGVWVDTVRRMDAESHSRLVMPSQGIHLVVDREFLPGDHALLVPKTKDGRVLFALPWLGKVLLGTTDTPRDDLDMEPRPFPDEVDFVLSESARYLAPAPKAADVRSAWAGLRPLVRPPKDDGADTKALSREHTVVVDPSGLVTVTGGKWTTYRAMAEDVLETCIRGGLLPPRGAGRTRGLRLVGAPAAVSHSLSDAPGAHLFGSEEELLSQIPGNQRQLGPGLTEAMVRFAVRYEGARTVEDVLARRSRLLFLDAALSSALAEPVAEVLRDEMGSAIDATASAAAFKALAHSYLL